MRLIRLQATLTLRNGVVIWYCSGWLMWHTGQTSRRGRLLFTLRRAHDEAACKLALVRLASAGWLARGLLTADQVCVMNPAVWPGQSDMRAGAWTPGWDGTCEWGIGSAPVLSAHCRN